jgi:hypothetical protein
MTGITANLTERFQFAFLRRIVRLVLQAAHAPPTREAELGPSTGRRALDLPTIEEGAGSTDGEARVR